jgi:hypothetical protein
MSDIIAMVAAAISAAGLYLQYRAMHQSKRQSNSAAENDSESVA